LLIQYPELEDPLTGRGGESVGASLVRERPETTGKGAGSGKPRGPTAVHNSRNKKEETEPNFLLELENFRGRDYDKRLSVHLL